MLTQIFAYSHSDFYLVGVNWRNVGFTRSLGYLARYINKEIEYVISSFKWYHVIDTSM